jgi:autotransporter family porin
MVVLNPNFEPRPDNYPANNTVPTSADLAQVGTLGYLDSHGNGLLGKVTGNFTGTTDEILQWASYKWGFDPNVTRAIAVNESYWHQDDVGDVGNGVSLGILQVKSSDYPGTCNPVSLNGGDTSYMNDPLCLSHLMTAFAADYKLAYQRACMDGSIGYLNQETPTGGHANYANATGDERLWGCVGNWYSGDWYDSGAIEYIEQVQAYLASEPWLQPGF